MFWSKRDKWLFLCMVMVTTVILTLLTNEVYFKLRVENYIKQEYGEDIKGTKINSELTLQLLNKSKNDSIGERRN